MSHFSVDHQELRELAHTARALQADLDPEAVRGNTLSGVGGTTDVEWRTNDFVGAWATGLGAVRENLGVLAERLDAAGAAYAAADQSVQRNASALQGSTATSAQARP